VFVVAATLLAPAISCASVEPLGDITAFDAGLSQAQGGQASSGAGGGASALTGAGGFNPDTVDPPAA